MFQTYSESEGHWDRQMDGIMDVCVCKWWNNFAKNNLYRFISENFIQRSVK